MPTGTVSVGTYGLGKNRRLDGKCGARSAVAALHCSIPRTQAEPDVEVFWNLRSSVMSRFDGVLCYHGLVGPYAFGRLDSALRIAENPEAKDDHE